MPIMSRTVYASAISLMLVGVAAALRGANRDQNILLLVGILLGSVGLLVLLLAASGVLGGGDNEPS